MRKLICILFILFCYQAHGQFVVFYDGHPVLFEGSPMYATAYSTPRPTPPPTPNPPPDWEDYIDDSIFFITFDELGGADVQYTNSDIAADWVIDGNAVTSSMYGGGAHAINDYNLAIVELPRLDDGTSGQTSTYMMTGTMDDEEYNLTGQVSDDDAVDDGGGFRFYPQMGSTYSGEMISTYNLILYPGMDFVAGGKLPSMHGGCWNDYDGCSRTGWSAAINFTGSKPGPPYQAEGGLTWYARWPAKSTSGGNGNWLESDSSTAFQFDVTDTTVVNITIRVCQNTYGSADGMLEGFVNGKKAGQWEGLILRTSPGVYIDELSLDFFYGGSSTYFATTRDEKIAILDWATFPGSSNGVGKAVRVRYAHGESLPYLPFYDITNEERYDY